MQVYYFTSEVHALNDLQHGHIKISRINELNDPFELLGAAVPERKARRDFKRWKTDMANRYGIICFCAGWENPIMWSHYADRHRGICLGFEVSNTHLKEVKYKKGRPVFHLSKKWDKEDFDKLIVTKAESWSYEEEYRLCICLEDAECDKDNLYFKKFNNHLRLKQVITGHDCPIPKKDLVQLVSEYPGRIKITKARLAFNSFRVVENKQGFRYSNTSKE